MVEDNMMFHNLRSLHIICTINFAAWYYLQGYWDGYDPNINPNVIDAFAAAAFRFGHSLLPTAIEWWSKAHKFIGRQNHSYISDY